MGRSDRYYCWQIDDALDANGHSTIRVHDGSQHGDTDLPVIATVYDEGNAFLVEQAPAMFNLLKTCLPMLVKMGDFVGNGPINPDRAGSLGVRCDLIGDIRRVEG